MNRPLRILCAEDNALLGDVLLTLFARAGHWVEQVEDGLTAWDRVSQDLNSYDVIVTDHEMPGLTGLELVELLRQAAFRGRIIVHCSGLSHEDESRYRALGVDTILFKSSQSQQLLGAVETGAAR